MTFPSPYPYSHVSDEHEPPLFSMPTHGTDIGFALANQHIVPSPTNFHGHHARNVYTAPQASLYSPSACTTPYKRSRCHLMRLTLELRLVIYELALDLSTPRRVTLSRPAAWKEKHLTQSDKIQHASAVLDIITKGTESKHDLRYDFKLRQHSAIEARDMTQALWPPLLRVCREFRAEGIRIFYSQVPFVAPADPCTVPEWEAKLPIQALNHLARNPNLILEHLCGEKEQWRCLRNYLYNAARQPYQVVNPIIVSHLWGPDAVHQRQNLKSIPWRFVQRDTLLNKYKVVTIDMNDMLLAEDSTLHICFHNEFLEEISRISNIQDRMEKTRQLSQLREGIGNFFRKLLYKEESEDWYRLGVWLQGWRDDPFGAAPAPLYAQPTPGGLFWGNHLFEVDVLKFLQDVNRNRLTADKAGPSGGRMLNIAKG